MTRAWISIPKTGVRYYETAEMIVDPEDKRKRRPARVYALTYWMDGKARSEGIGPEPEITETYALEVARTLAENRKKGIRPFTYSEMKEARNAEYQAVKAEEEKARKNTFGAFYEEIFLPWKKSVVATGDINQGTLDDIVSRYNYWLNIALEDMKFDREDLDRDPNKEPEPTGPAISSLTFDEIEDTHFQHLAAKMRRKVCKIRRVRDYAKEDKDKAEGRRFIRHYIYERHIEERRTIRLVQAVRGAAFEVWDMALRKGYAKKAFPGSEIAQGTVQNERTRFYTEAEAELILNELKRRSLSTYHLAMISLYTGLRAGACLKLTWQNLEEGYARNTKNKINVPIPLLHSVHDLKNIITERKKMFPGCKKSDWVFPKKGKPEEHQDQVSKTFKVVIEDLRINEEIDNRSAKGVFHTLRHTFASWLVQDGESLTKVGKFMGQKTPRMTSRYSHLAPEHYQSAADKMNARKLNISE